MLAAAQKAIRCIRELQQLSLGRKRAGVSMQCDQVVYFSTDQDGYCGHTDDQVRFAKMLDPVQSLTTPPSKQISKALGHPGVLHAWAFICAQANFEGAWASWRPARGHSFVLKQISKAPGHPGVLHAWAFICAHANFKGAWASWRPARGHSFVLTQRCQPPTSAYSFVMSQYNTYSTLVFGPATQSYAKQQAAPCTMQTGSRQKKAVGGALHHAKRL